MKKKAAPRTRTTAQATATAPAPAADPGASAAAEDMKTGVLAVRLGCPTTQALHWWLQGAGIPYDRDRGMITARNAAKAEERWNKQYPDGYTPRSHRGGGGGAGGGRGRDGGE